MSASATSSRCKRLGAVAAFDDDLGEQRIVEGGNLGAALDPGLDAGRRGEVHVGERAGRRLKILARILGVNAHLDRSTLRRGFPVREIEFAGRGAQHPLDEIDAGDFLGHAVLDLQARVDLEEIEFARGVVVDEFDRAGVLVAGGSAETGGAFRAAGCAAPRSDRARVFPR